MEILRDLTVTKIEEPITVHFLKGKTVQMRNRRCYGLSFCSSGQLTYTQNGRQFLSDPNHAVFLPLDGTYSIFGDREGYFPVLNFSCEGLNCPEILSIPLSNPQSCLRDCETLRSIFLFSGSRAKAFSVFYGLLDKLSDAACPGTDPLAPAIRYIESNLQDPSLSNTQLAAEAGISEVYLRRLFAKRHHTTPKQYILELRLQKAKQLLTQSPATVTETAEQCGFSNLYHFCRIFKEKTGLTPTQYAKRHRISSI
jgi:AraC-like DNA-binding protein